MSAAARAFWIAAPGQGEIRTAPLPPPGPGDVLVHAAASGISRGTESLVFRGAVPASQHGVMRCPFQEGGFPAPVKYGYAVAGRTEEGARVFCLHPHQDRFVLPRDAAVPIPAGVPDRRAVLAASRGMHCIYLGPDLPVTEIGRLCAHRPVEAVALGIVTQPDVIDAHAQLVELRTLLPESVRIWVSGHAGIRLARTTLPSGIEIVPDIDCFEQKLAALKSESTH